MIRDIPKHWKARIAADPDSEFAREALAIQSRLQKIAHRENKIRSAENKSYVGTRLLKRFQETVGAVPCSACKNTMIRLNLTSVSEIRANHEDIVIEIEKNARNAKASWWANLMIKADEIFTDGIVTRLLISKLLSEACDEDERESQKQDYVLADHSRTDHMGGTSDGAEQTV